MQILRRFAVLFLLATLGAQPVAQSAELRVGAARVSITPEAAAFPYLPSDTPSLNLAAGERAFVGVHDEVYARAVVMDDGTRRIALVVLEVTTVPSPAELVQAIAAALRIDERHLMLAATHTHNVPLFTYAGGAPSTRERREIERLKQGAVAAALQAQAALQPARVAFGSGAAWINVNNGQQRGLKSGHDPAGISDKTLDVLRFSALDGAPIAMVVTYASHAEVMFRSITKNNGYEVSGDLPGAVSRLLEGQADAAPVVLFTSGAEGNQLVQLNSLQRAGRLPAADQGAAGWSLLNVQARRVAESALSVVAAMPPAQAATALSATTAKVSCPGQELRIDASSGKVTISARPPVDIPLTVMRIGDIVLAGVAGDVASEIGMNFRAKSPHPKTLFITMLAGSIGYILPDSSYANPGHGLTKSPLQSGCAERAIVDALLRLMP